MGYTISIICVWHDFIVKSKHYLIIDDSIGNTLNMAGPINILSERIKHTLHDSYRSCFNSYKWDSMWQLSVEFRQMLSGFEGLCNIKLLWMNVNSCSFYLKVSTEHFPFRKQQGNAKIFPRLNKLLYVLQSCILIISYEISRCFQRYG